MYAEKTEREVIHRICMRDRTVRAYYLSPSIPTKMKVIFQNGTSYYLYLNDYKDQLSVSE